MLLQKGLQASIISVLCEQFPLQVHELRAALESYHQKKRTTQAIHGALNELLRERVVTRCNHAYQLDTDYILSLAQIVERMKSNYFLKTTQSFHVPKNGKRLYTVFSLLELDNLYNSILSEVISNYPPKAQSYFIQVPHAWFSLTNFEAEIQITSLFYERCLDFYTIVNNSTVLDCWIKRFYEGKNARYLTRKRPVERDNDRHLSIFGSYSIDSRYPKPLAARVHNIFNATSSLSRLNLQELVATVNAPTEIMVTVRNNLQYADRLKSKLLAEF